MEQVDAAAVRLTDALAAEEDVHGTSADGADLRADLHQGPRPQ
ncbi:hypothetical protein [Streptomyces sp. V1I6]|nr:hypothetical protein [Streptomyces sp. V1I6]MDQ0847901.1 hypothetical protein [Streptomyces sp. V1I6]